jgi:hypothetical protein
MAIEDRFHPQTEENAGSYAGLIGFTFMIGILGSRWGQWLSTFFLLHEPDPEREDYVEMKRLKYILKQKASPEGSNRSRMVFLL